jgi:general secretion pathway protein G
LKKIKKGFTLIELLVVIAIIAILAAVIAPNAFKAIEKSKVSRVKAEAKALRAAALSYYADMGFFPPDVNRGSDPGIYSKVTTNLSPQEQIILDNNWQGPYIDKWPETTPWEENMIGIYGKLKQQDMKRKFQQEYMWE